MEKFYKPRRVIQKKTRTYKDRLYLAIIKQPVSETWWAVRSSK